MNDYLGRLGLCFLVLLYSVSSAWGGSLVSNTRLTVPGGGEPYDSFGAAIAVTPDGKTALIGATDDSGVFSPGWYLPGAAYFFSSYAAAAGTKVTPLDPPVDGRFGAPLALADNGTTAVIGAPSATVDGKYFHGVAYIFSNNNGVWSQQARLVDPDGASGTGFGCVADIADDGNTVLIGSCSNFTENLTIGSVSVFVRENGNWRLQKKFRGKDTEADDAFPSAVALAGDGNTALVGAFMDTVGGNNDQGSVYVFVRSGQQWLQQEQLTAGDGAQWSMFGNAVALSNDGNTAMIGNSRKNAAYVFTRGSGGWSQQARLTPADLNPYSSNFAASLALSNSGDVAVLGDNQCARLFVRNGSTWQEQEKLTTKDTEAYGFGQTLALADDGRTVLVGASGATIGGNTSQGAVYVFRPPILLPGANMLLLNSP